MSILKCSDNRYYVGCTNNLKDRIKRHEEGYISATAERLPIKLICYVAFLDNHTAFAFEKYLKSGSGSIHKAAFTVGDGVDILYHQNLSSQG